MLTFVNYITSISRRKNAPATTSCLSLQRSENIQQRLHRNKRSPVFSAGDIRSVKFLKDLFVAFGAYSMGELRIRLSGNISFDIIPPDLLLYNPVVIPDPPAVRAYRKKALKQVSAFPFPAQQGNQNAEDCAEQSKEEGHWQMIRVEHVEGPREVEDRPGRDRMLQDHRKRMEQEETQKKSGCSSLQVWTIPSFHCPPIGRKTL